MRGFPPTYLNGPQAPNPHLAATYMANLNKAAAYAQAAAAVANNTMPRHYSYQVESIQDHIFRFLIPLVFECMYRGSPTNTVSTFTFFTHFTTANLNKADTYAQTAAAVANNTMPRHYSLPCRVNSRSDFRFLIPLVLLRQFTYIELFYSFLDIF